MSSGMTNVRPSSAALARLALRSATAARVLAYATLETSRTGHHLRLRGCGPAVRRMLHLTRLARVIEVERVAASA